MSCVAVQGKALFTQKGMSKKEPNCVFLRHWWDAIKAYDVGTQCKICRAIVAYNMDGEVPDGDDELRILFPLFKVEIDNNLLKYKEICEKRAQSGRLGGEAKQANQNVANVANGSKCYQMVANGSKCKQNVANVANACNKNKNINKNINIIEKEIDKEKESVVATNVATLKGREEKFCDEVRRYAGLYDMDMLDKFISYWTEPNKSGTKMRFELERTWDTKRRLKTWSNREYGNNRQYSKNEANSIIAQSIADDLRNYAEKRR